MRKHLTPLRLIIAVTSAMAGTIHAAATVDHLHAPVLLVGGFLAAAVAQLAVAGAALVVSDPRRLVGVVIAVHLPCLAVWTISRTMGLGPLHNASTVGALDLLAAAFAACAVLATVLLIRERPRRSLGTASLSAAVLAIGLLGATPFVAVDTGPEHHHGQSDHGAADHDH